MESLASLIKFFRETVRRLGLASSKPLYTPKLDKDMKFVAHDSTIARDRDFFSNLALYIEALQEKSPMRN